MTSSNKTANINVKTAIYTNVDGDIYASKTAKSAALWHFSYTCWRLMSPFMILAVFDA